MGCKISYKNYVKRMNEFYFYLYYNVKNIFAIKTGSKLLMYWIISNHSGFSLK